MVRTLRSRLLVIGSAVLGAVLCAAFFWFGSGQQVLQAPLISWAVAGAIVGGLTARALLID